MQEPGEGPQERAIPVFQPRDDDKEIYGEDLGEQFKTFQVPDQMVSANFQPVTREVDEIFKEDEENADKYANICEEDDKIYVEGLPGELALIDTWEDAMLPETLMTNIKRCNYVKPRQIQRAAVPLILDNYDVIGHAETGSGKTAAFLIPIIAECITHKKEGKFATTPFYPFALIIGPTRELVKQCYDQARKFAEGSDVIVAKAYGEYPTGKNRDELRAGCDILCATPGRLLDFASSGYIKPNLIRFLVLDEGDSLLEDGYMKDIQPVIDLPSFPTRDTRQTLIFSATFEHSALMKAKELCRPEGLRGYVTNKKNVTNKKCTQEFIAVPKVEKFLKLRQHFLEELAKVDNDPKKLEPTLVFASDRSECEKITIGLTVKGIPTLPLSGLRNQELREKAFEAFRSKDTAVLVVTDVLARGIDVKELHNVIIYDLPKDLETYIHRSGRVGRIEAGKCISYVDVEKDIPLLQRLKKAMEKYQQVVPDSLNEILANAPAAEENGLVIQNGETEWGNDEKAPDVVSTEAPKPDSPTEILASQDDEKQSEA